jgi:hypothetical protein
MPSIGEMEGGSEIEPGMEAGFVMDNVLLLCSPFKTPSKSNAATKPLVLLISYAGMVKAVE